MEYVSTRAGNIALLYLIEDANSNFFVLHDFDLMFPYVT